jgi:uncharacterized protein (DUF58 family)
MQTEYQQYMIEGQRAGLRYCLVPPRNVPQGLIGMQMGNRPGSSLEFMDHREYQPGDDLRRIDWSAYARSDKLTVKLYREEVNPHVDIVIDGSASMALQDSRKAHATLALAALLAQSADNAGYAHRAWLAGEVCQEITNSTEQPATWQSIDFDYTGNPGESLMKQTSPLQPRGIRIFISDLLWLYDPMATLLRLLEKATSVFVIQLLAKADVAAPERGNIRLVDSETQQILELFIDASTQQRYRDRLSGHQQNWHNCTRQCGATMATLIAEDMLANWDLSELLQKEILRVS